MERMKEQEGLAPAGTFAPMRSATITPKWMRATSSSSVRAGRASSVTDARAAQLPSPPRAERSFIASTLL